MLLIQKMNSDDSFPDLYIVIISFAGVSLILTLGLLFFSFCAKIKTTNAFVVVMNIIISNLVHVLSYTLNWVKNNNQLLFPLIFCDLQSILMVWSSMSQELWITLYVLVAYLNLLKGKNFEGKKWTDFLLYSFVCYLIPLGISLAFYFTEFFGKNNLYCWITIEHTQHLIAEITIYGIRYINFFINLLFTFLIIKFVLSHYDDDTSVKEKGIQFIIYPSIQLLGMIIPSLNRIFQVFNVTSVLEVPGTISVMLQGLLFPICYGWTSHAFYFLINCCKPVRPDNISDNISDYLTDDSALIDESNH